MSVEESHSIDATASPDQNSDDTMPTSPLHEQAPLATDTTTVSVSFPTDISDSDMVVPLTRHDTEYTEFTQTTISSQTTVAMASNFFGSIANLCSATLGAGILALPYAFYQAGFVFGSLLLIISAWATSTSIGLLVQACDKYRLPTYEKIVERVLGRRARNIVEVSILIFCCGTAVGYVIAVGDIMERVVYMTRAQKRMAMCVVWLAAMLPLSCLRRMQSLQCASSVGIMSIFTLIVAATVHLVHPPEDDSKPLFEDEIASNESEFGISSLVGPAGMSWLSVVNACPIFFYAFSCQVNVAQIYEELPGRYGEEKMKRMGWVTWCAVGICALLYASISIVSLIDFGDGVKPNILSCYDLNIPGQPVLHVAIFAMATAVVMAFPLNIFPSRVAIIQMWEKEHHGETLLCGDANEEVKQPLLSKAEDGHAGYDSGGETNRDNAESHEDPLRMPPAAEIIPSSPGNNSSAIGSLDEEEEEPEFHLLQHASITLLLAGIALGCALVIPNISVVFGLLGGTTSSLLGFIVPGLLGLKMDKKSVNSWILVVAGTIIGLLTTSVTIYTTFHSVKK